MLRCLSYRRGEITVIRWGTIGCGSVCEVKSAPALAKATGSSLAAVMARTAATAESYAARHNVPRWTTDPAEIIHADDVDAVYIATPVSTHLDYALEVAAAGKPCYVEKPIARCVEEASTLHNAFAEAGLPLFVAYYRRALPRFVELKTHLQNGTIGELQNVRHTLTRTPFPGGDLPWRLEAEHAGGGFFMDLGSHTLDLLDWLVGPLTLTNSTVERRDTQHYLVDDFVDLTFTAGEVTGRGGWDFTADHRSDELEFRGTNGVITMSCFGDDAMKIRHQNDDPREGDVCSNPPHIQLPLIQSMVDELNGLDTRCPSTGHSALRTAEFMDATLAPYYGARPAGFWATPDSWPGLK